MGEDRELHRPISGSAARLQPERFAAQPQRGSLDGQWATNELCNLLTKQNIDVYTSVQANSGSAKIARKNGERVVGNGARLQPKTRVPVGGEFFYLNWP